MTLKSSNWIDGFYMPNQQQSLFHIDWIEAESKSVQFSPLHFTDWSATHLQFSWIKEIAYILWLNQHSKQNMSNESRRININHPVSQQTTAFLSSTVAVVTFHFYIIFHPVYRQTTAFLSTVPVEMFFYHSSLYVSFLMTLYCDRFSIIL